MRAVVQRTREARVLVHGAVHSAIPRGLLVYLGVDRNDDESDARYVADKVRHLRIFPDEAGLMNLDVRQASGSVLLVSAFTVQGDVRRGRRPSFESAAAPDRAFVLYELVGDLLGEAGLTVQRGAFGEEMFVESTNDGPVCVLLESRRVF